MPSVLESSDRLGQAALDEPVPLGVEAEQHLVRSRVVLQRTDKRADRCMGVKVSASLMGGTRSPVCDVSGASMAQDTGAAELECVRRKEEFAISAETPGSAQPTGRTTCP